MRRERTARDVTRIQDVQASSKKDQTEDGKRAWAVEPQHSVMKAK